MVQEACDSGYDVEKIYHRSEWVMTVLQVVESLDELRDAEIKHIGNLWKTDNMCLNSQRGGNGVRKHSESSIARMREVFNTNRESRVFKFHDNFSVSGIQRLKDNHTGSKNPMFGRKGKDNVSSKKVRCIELDLVFDSMATATRETNVPTQNISKVCSGKRRTAGGYHWEYCD
jgi:hypothetical protein